MPIPYEQRDVDDDDDDDDEPGRNNSGGDEDEERDNAATAGSGEGQDAACGSLDYLGQRVKTLNIQHAKHMYEKQREQKREEKERLLLNEDASVGIGDGRSEGSGGVNTVNGYHQHVYTKQGRVITNKGVVIDPPLNATLVMRVLRSEGFKIR
jgi:hypothetical protein